VTSTKQSSLLSNRNFRQLFLADTVSQLGAEVAPVALPLIAVLLLKATALEIGLLAGFETLAFLVIGLPAGAWVDRSSKRRVIIRANLARAVVIATVPVAYWVGILSIGQMFVVALIGGVCTVFFDTAYYSYLPTLVERDQLVAANARLQTVQSVAEVAGPGFGGLLIQLLTAPFAILATVFGNAWSAACLTRIHAREPIPEQVEQPNLRREIGEGLRFVLKHPALRRITVCTSTFNLFWTMGTPMLLLLLARDLRLSAGMIGLLLSCGGLGGVTGGLFVDRIIKVLGQGPAIWIGAAVAGLAGLLMPLAQRDWRLALVGVGQFVAASGMIVYNVSLVSFRQSMTPQRLMARVGATGRFLVWGTMPLGGFIGGVLGSTMGPRAALVVATGGATLSFLWIFFSPLRWMRTLPES
jgi:predicted MFS family arabinose efflux permease